jgi:3-oxoacyl-[acyl-carrier-protein] synthase-3
MTAAQQEAAGLVSWGLYIPETRMEAGDIAKASGIPEDVIREKFGLNRKPVSGPNEHVADMAILAARRALEAGSVDPRDVDVVIYYGSAFKDYHVWPVVCQVQHAVGANQAFAFEVMALCASGPIALKVARDMILSDPAVSTVLLVVGSKEASLLDYSNLSTRFMFNFADGAAAAVVRRGWPANRILSSGAVTDGSFALDVYLQLGGSRLRGRRVPPDRKANHLEVPDSEGMKERLDRVSLENFLTVIRRAVERSGYAVEDIDFIGITHMKRSFYGTILESLGLDWSNTFYLEDYGHVQAADQMIIIDEAVRTGRLRDGDLVVLAGAGTGYTWSATALRWGAVTA